MYHRPPTRDDAAIVVELMRAAQIADGDEPDMTQAELLSDWEEIDLAQEAMLFLDESRRPIACADLLNRRFVQLSVYGTVPPHAQQSDLWAAIIHWSEGWLQDRLHLAPVESRVAIQHFVRSTNQVAAQILHDNGYANVRTHYVMRAMLSAQRPAAQWAPGLGVGTYRPGVDDQALFAAGEEAFQDLWDRPPSTLERWLQPTQAEDFDPTLWFLAQEEKSGQVIGVCLCSILDQIGHVGVVGVRKAWRRQGVGLALLNHGLAELRDRGVPHAELSVDAASPTGAPALYSRAGFDVAKSYHRFQKELRPGAVYLPDQT